MAQIVHGLRIAEPNGPGTPQLGLLYGFVPPADSTDAAVASVLPGSLYVDLSGVALWFKSAAPNTWTQVSIP